MKTLRGDELKKYFSSEGTVSKWWHPEDGDYRFFYQQELRILENHFPVHPGWNILDVATGEGRYARRFAKKHCQVTAVDINPEMISAGKKKASVENVHTKIDFVIGDLKYLELKGESFDVVSCMDSLDHMENLPRTIERLAYHLKPKGFLLITFVSRISIYGILHALYRNLARFLNANFIDLSRTYTLREIKTAFHLFEIKVVDHFGIGLVCTPQTRVPLPSVFKNLLLGLAKAEVAVKPYYHSRWLTPHCSTLVVIGQKEG